MSKKALKNGHAEHIHANCDCQYAVRFDGKSTVEGYDPDEYREMYDNAEGNTPQEKLNSMRRSLTAEMKRRKIGEQGQEIIDKATYNKLTQDFLQRGGIIIRGEEAEQHLKAVGAYASYIVGADTAIIRDDATVSDVLEEMYHAEQDRTGIYADLAFGEMTLRREIDAQNYLLNSAKRYKIPVEETEVTRANLAKYELQLKKLKGGE